MRQILKSLFLSAIAMICFTTAIQAQHYEAITTDEVFHSAATMPRFPGGNDGLMKYLSTHIRYPKAAQDNNIQGKVVIQFVVEKDGSIGEVEVARSVDPVLDQEAVRVCKSLPKFFPGENAAGEPVRVWYTLPVTFKLNEGSTHYEDPLTKLQRQAEEGDAEAQLDLAKKYYDGEDLDQDYAQAFNWFQKAADQGNDDAQYYLGMCYRDGKGVKKDEKKAIYWLTKAAEQDDEDAQSELVNIYIAKKDYDKAFAWYMKLPYHEYDDIPGMLLDKAELYCVLEKDNWLGVLQESAKKGNPKAIATMAGLHAMGKGVKLDEKKAVKLFSESLKKQNLPYNDVTIADVYYDIYAREHSSAYIARALCDYDLSPWLEKAAELGHPEAQNMMGEFCSAYREDPEKAAEWFKKAAEQGNAQAQYNLAYLYFMGIGVEEDEDLSAQWLMKAAQQGYAEAQYVIGDFYYYGNGSFDQDYTKAADWYEKAAEQGYVNAQNDLGHCYSNGFGRDEDPAQAAQWYRKAAEQGNTLSQFNLANCYYEGKGVPQDFEQAIYWFKDASEEDKDAAQKLPLLYALTKDYDNAIYWYKKNNDEEENEYLNYLGNSYILYKIAADAYPDKNYLTVLEDASAMGSDDASLALAGIYAIGEDVTRDDDKAVEYYTKYLEQYNGEIETKPTIADVYYAINNVAYYNKFFEAQNGEEWLEKAANLGHSDAQYYMGAHAYYEDDYDNTIAWWKKAAETGNVDAMRRLGDLYEDGDGVAADHKTALQWFMKAAEKDDEYSQNLIGECYLKGNGLPRDAKKAVQWFEKAAEQGHRNAYYNLGLCYLQGKGVKQDYKKAAEMLAEYNYVDLSLPVLPYSAVDEDSGSDDIQLTEFRVVEDEYVLEPPKVVEDVLRNDRVVGTQDILMVDEDEEEEEEELEYSWQQYFKGIEYLNANDYQKGVLWLDKAAQNGDSDAMSLLACFYAIGKDVPQDNNKAIGYYRQFVNATNTKIDHNITIADVYYHIFDTQFYNPHVRNQCDEKMSQWLEKAAEMGVSDAQKDLAYAYLYGMYGFDEDYYEAKTWYTKAAEQGNVSAQRELGKIYSASISESDQKSAVEWLQKAANQNDPAAQYFLAQHYQEGTGVKKNASKANQFYKKAANGFKTEADKMKASLETPLIDVKPETDN